MVGESHVPCVLLTLTFLFLSKNFVLSVKKCKNTQCSEPISVAKAVKDHFLTEGKYLKFKKGDEILVFSKDLEKDSFVWEGMLKDSAQGFFLSDYVQETTKFAQDEQLVSAADATRQEATDNHRSDDDYVVQDVQVTVLEDGKPEREYIPGVDGPALAKIERPEEADEGNMDNGDKSRNKYNMDHIQKADEENSKAPDNSFEMHDIEHKSEAETEKYSDKNEADGSSKIPSEEDTNNVNDNQQRDSLKQTEHQSAADQSEKSNSDETPGKPGESQPEDVAETREVPLKQESQPLTSDGVVKNRASQSTDAGRDNLDTGSLKNDDLSENSDFTNTDAKKEASPDEQLPEILGQALPDGSKAESKKAKKEGFFSSMKNLVTNFTENIIKDLQGEDDQKGKTDADSKTLPEPENTKSDNTDRDSAEVTPSYGETEERMAGQTTTQAPQQEEEVKMDSGEDEGLDTGSSFADRLRQLKAEQILRVKAKLNQENNATDDFREKMKQEAKRTVEGIPALMQEVKNRERNEKETNDLGKNVEEALSEKAGEPSLPESEREPSDNEVTTENEKKYSDKMLCDSVPKPNRENCLKNDDREECRKENCCFDESAGEGEKCFFKPSEIESGVEEEPTEEEQGKPDERKDNVTVTENKLNQGQPLAPDKQEHLPTQESRERLELRNPSSTGKANNDKMSETVGIQRKDSDDDVKIVSSKLSDKAGHIFRDDSSVSSRGSSAEGKNSGDKAALQGDTRSSNAYGIDINEKITSKDALLEKEAQIPSEDTSVGKQDVRKVTASSVKQDSVHDEEEKDVEDGENLEQKFSSGRKKPEGEAKYKEKDEKEGEDSNEDEDKKENENKKDYEDKEENEHKREDENKNKDEVKPENEHKKKDEDKKDNEDKQENKDKEEDEAKKKVEDMDVEQKVGQEKRPSPSSNEDDKREQDEGYIKDRHHQSTENEGSKSRSVQKPVKEEKQVKSMVQNETMSNDSESSGIDDEKNTLHGDSTQEQKREIVKDSLPSQEQKLEMVKDSLLSPADSDHVTATTSLPKLNYENIRQKPTPLLSQTNTVSTMKIQSTDDEKGQRLEEKHGTSKLELTPSNTEPSSRPGTLITTAATPSLDRKHEHIASKWMKNKLKDRAQLLAEKFSEHTTDHHKDDHTKNDSDKQPNTNKDHEETSSHVAKDSQDQDSGTCTKEGECKKTSMFSTKSHGGIFGKESVLVNEPVKTEGVKVVDAVIEEDEEGDGKEKEEIKEHETQEDRLKDDKNPVMVILANAVRTFRVYHTEVGEYGLLVLKPVKNIVKTLGKQMGLSEVIVQLESELKQGPQGVIPLIIIMITFASYFMLSVLCGKKLPPCYGPNLKDIFKTYEGRIKILEQECTGYQEAINGMTTKASQEVGRNFELEQALEDEKHKRSKSDEQITILKEIVKNLNEKVDLLEEESTELKQSLEEKNNRFKTFEEQLAAKDKETEATNKKIGELEKSLDDKRKEMENLQNDINDYKEQLAKAEDDSYRHKDMLQDWNDRYHELQQKYDDVSVSKQSLEEQLHFKDNEIEVLRESLVQINSDVHINSDEELSEEELKEERARKIQELMNVSQIKTDYKLCKEEKEKLEENIKQEVDRREKLEGDVEQLEIDLAKTKASEEEIRFKYREADIKLSALQDYFKNMESDLHRKLTAEEAARVASESQLERKLREASTAVQDVELYRKQVDELRKEIDETQQAFRSQVASTEERAHENWLKFRSAERELEEMKRERDALRRRMYDLETNIKPSASPEDTISLGSVPGDKFEPPAMRSESPSSVRSKRKNSDPRTKSPSSVSPLDERKDRVRRKTRERNSPPSWEPDIAGASRRRGRDKDTTPPPPPFNPDMPPPSRRRDKDRETPPPPPWDPSLGPPPRRRGQREPPARIPPPGGVDLDSQLRRRDRYSPSPPPPPPDADIGPPRRRRRDKHSSPPPPPPNILASRGISLTGAPPPRGALPPGSQFNSTYRTSDSNNGVPGPGTQIRPPPTSSFAGNGPYTQPPITTQSVPNGPTQQFVPIRPAPRR